MSTPVKGNTMNIYDYEDFKLFLVERLKEKELTNSRFAEKLGLKSHNYLGLILTGKRKFTVPQLIACQEVLDLTHQELDHFMTMVQREQSETEAERAYYHHKLMLQKQERYALNYIPATDGTLHILSRWYYHILIHNEILEAPLPIEELSRVFRVRKEVLLEDLEGLRRMGILEQNEAGRWVPSVKNIRFTTKNSPPNAVKEHLRDNLQRLSHDFDRLWSKEAQFKSKIIMLPKDSYKKLWEKIKVVIDEVGQEYETPPFDRAVHINIQYYDALS